MSNTAVITGGGSGLGQSLAKQLAEKGITVYIIGRRHHKLNETRRFSPHNIIPITADISKEAGRKTIVQQLKHISIDYLVHNAAIVKPIMPLQSITLKQWQKIQSTNVEAPVFLTQRLLPRLKKHSRILLISSDCATYPLRHWIPYCTSKAALLMFYECLKKELVKRDIYVGSVDPGMMATPMQQYICSKDVRFPEKYSRKTLKEKELLFTADYSASFCASLLLTFSAETFMEKNWCVVKPKR